MFYITCIDISIITKLFITDYKKMSATVFKLEDRYTLSLTLDNILFTFMEIYC